MGKGNDLSTLAGQAPQGPSTMPGGHAQAALLERAMLAEQVLTSMVKISPDLAGPLDNLVLMLRQAVVGVLQGQGQGAPQPGPAMGPPAV